jgi:putative SOS response-associated peptidase YedK
LNARIETLEQLPSFKDASANRCLIPATCFYEWRHEGTLKKPYRISSTEDEIFSFAGIYSDWTNPVTGDTQRTYSLITTEANACMEFIHNTKKRMPVILHSQDESTWLKGSPISNFAFPYSCNLLGLPI